MPSKGRPFGTSPILNDRLTRAIAQSIANGNYFKTACEANGVQERTAYDWLEKANRDHPEGPYAQFASAVTRAGIEWEERCVTYVMKAAATDWRAALEILQRREPDRWGNVQKIKVNSEAVEEFSRGVVRVVKDALAESIPDPGTRKAALAAVLAGLAQLSGERGAAGTPA